MLQNFGFVVFDSPEPVQDILKQKVSIGCSSGFVLCFVCAILSMLSKSEAANMVMLHRVRTGSLTMQD